MCSRLGTQRATFQLLPESAQESMLKGGPISEQRLKRATVCHVFLPYPAHRAPHSSVIPRPGRTLRTMDLGRDLVKRAVTSSLPAQLSVDHANDFSLREWVTHVQTATLLHVFMNEQQYLFKRINKGEQVGGAGRRSLEQVRGWAAYPGMQVQTQMGILCTDLGWQVPLSSFPLWKIW